MLPLVIYITLSFPSFADIQKMSIPTNGFRSPINPSMPEEVQHTHVSVY